MTNTNYTLKYLNQHLLDCETGIDEIWLTVNGIGETVEIVDILGTIEEKGRIYVGLEVVTSDFPFGHIIHINFMNTWDFVYKDEMVEIQDVLSNLISKQLKTDLGLKDNILDDVKVWGNEQLKENEQLREYDNIIDVLNGLNAYGGESGIVSFLIYDNDIQLYYKEHREEINNIVEEETGYSIDDAIEDLEAFETVINNVGGLDSEMEFENSHELENSELCWFVWLAFEHVAHEYLTQLESE